MRDRIDRLRTLLAARGLDGLVMAAPESLSNTPVRYLTGFSGSSSYLVVGRSGAWLLTDFRYIEVASVGADGYEVVQHAENYLDTLVEIVAGVGMKTVGFEAERVPVAMHGHWRERMPDVSWVPADDLLQLIRLVKDPGEIAKMRRAAEIAGQALEELLPQIGGKSERWLAAAFEYKLRELGLDGPGFPTLVGAGEHGALPHAHPSDRTIRSGDLVVIDFGGMCDGYRSDETVTVAVEPVDAMWRAIYRVVEEALAAGVASVRPSVRASQVDRACRLVIEEAGYGPNFGHGAGHGVGLDIHERPFARRDPKPDEDDVLEPGMTITVEPGIYLPGRGGVRLEELLVVTEYGHERLSVLSKTWRAI